MIKADIPYPEQCKGCLMCDESRRICLASYSKASVERWYGEGKPEWCGIKDDGPVKPIYNDAGIFCGNCNSYIRTSDTYCGSCGRKIDWAKNRRTGGEKEGRY